MRKKFKSTHKLKFQSAPHLIMGVGTGMVHFKIGTCHGLWHLNATSVDIWALVNDKPGNDHEKDVFEWFEEMARLKGLPLRMVEVNDLRQRKFLLAFGFLQTKIENQFVKFIT